MNASSDSRHQCDYRDPPQHTRELTLLLAKLRKPVAYAKMQEYMINDTGHKQQPDRDMNPDRHQATAVSSFELNTRREYSDRKHKQTPVADFKFSNLFHSAKLLIISALPYNLEGYDRFFAMYFAFTIS